MKMNFRNRFSKSTQISIFIKIRLLEAELSHRERTEGRMEKQRDTTKLKVAFLNSAKSDY